MKSKYIFIFFLLLWSSTQALAQYVSQYISPSVPESAVYSGTLINNNAYFLCYNKIVIAVRNGEQLDASFVAEDDDCAFGDHSYNLIAFADSLHGFVITTAGFFNTNDGARHWHYNSLNGYNIEAVTFVDSVHGWAIGPYNLYRTNDKGKTWQHYYDEEFLKGSYNFSRLYAINKDTLWALKSYHYSSGGEIYFSSNGGKTWQRQTMDIQVDKAHQLSFYDIKVKPDGSGIISAVIYYPDSSLRKTVFLRTDDFGTHWKAVYQDQDIRYYSLINLSDSLWLAYGNKIKNLQLYGYYSVSRDSGKTWKLHEMFLDGHYWEAPFAALYLPKKDEILIATAYHYFVSVDHGKTFTRLTPKYRDKIAEFDIDSTEKTNQQMAIALSKGKNYYFLSTDGGLHWKPKQLPAIFGTPKHAFIRNNKIFLFSDAGRFIYSTDAGKSWIRLNSEYIPSSISHIAAYSDKHFLAFDKSYKRFFLMDRTGDSLTVRCPYLNKNVEMNDYTLIPPAGVIACGRDVNNDVGISFYSDDGGYDWRITDIPFTNAPERMQMVNNKIGYMNNLREMYKTTDGGKHWKTILKSTDYYVFYSGFAFSDTLHGVMRGPYYFLETGDGGKKWTRKGVKGFRARVKNLSINFQGDLIGLTYDGYLIRFYEPNKNPSAPSSPPKVRPNVPVQNVLKIFPNPFNLSAKIHFKILKSEEINLALYNALGQKVLTIANGWFNSGSYVRTLQAKSLASGIYFIVLQTPSRHWAKKTLLIK